MANQNNYKDCYFCKHKNHYEWLHCDECENDVSNFPSNWSCTEDKICKYCEHYDSMGRNDMCGYSECNKYSNLTPNKDITIEELLKLIGYLKEKMHKSRMEGSRFS